MLINQRLVSDGGIFESERLYRFKAPNAGGNAGKEKNDSDFARARSLVLNRS
jgi:hypothetical protein